MRQLPKQKVPGYIEFLADAFFTTASRAGLPATSER